MFKHDERIIPHEYYRDVYSTYANYIGRYRFASRFLGPTATVLDLGCGCGYGSAHLAEAQGRVVLGVDRSAEATRYGRARYPSSRLRFVRADATAVPLKSDAVDAVVAMEMIEHVEDAKSVLSEARRVLRAGGVCLVSTPNRLVTGTAEKPSNPYHVREYTPDEFRAFLKGEFEEIVLYGQDVTPSFQAYQENMARIWHNLALIPALYDQLHALRARLEMDERMTGLSLIRKLKRFIAGGRGPAQEPAGGGTPDLNQAFRHAQALVNSIADWDVQPYGLEAAPVIVAVCRK